MVIATHNAPSGPQFLIDVARPPGDNCCEGGYSEQNVTRNAVLEQKLIKIPLRDYGLVTNITDNDFSPFSVDKYSLYWKRFNLVCSNELEKEYDLPCLGLLVEDFIS